MSLFKKKPDTAPAVDPHADADLDEVMRKYDRESNTRIWTGWRKTVIKVFMALLAVYCIVMTLFSTAMPEVRLPLFLGFIVIAGFLSFPARKGHVHPDHMPWYDLALMAVGAACFLYFALNALPIIQSAGRIAPYQVAIGIVGLLILMELCRRCVGVPILVVAGVLLVYTFINKLGFNPDFYQVLRKIIYQLFFTTSGVIGTPVNVCYTYIVLFIIFGAFLERTGIANFFISFANRLAGWSSGGPAKVAVISSALCGMVSGSSVGNTVTTGSFTIPMMKKTGYKPEFAGAVEAAASTGGQIMPPVMGATAFVICDILGMPYVEVCLCALVPALLYYIAVFIQVDLRAVKLNLRGLPADQLPDWRPILKKGWMSFLPIILLVVLLNYWSASKVGFWVIVSAIALSFTNKDTHMTPKKFYGALVDSGKGMLEVGVSCAISGIVVGVFGLTGLGLKFSNVLVTLAGGNLFALLIMTAIASIILGMGMSTLPVYLILATLVAPALTKMGIPPIAAHLFIFYYGIIAAITPPVAIAAYAGASIAKEDPIKVGLTACRLGVGAYILPFMFAFGPALVLQGTPLEIAQSIVTAIVGISCLGMAFEGYIYKIGNVNVVSRVLLIAGALCLTIPGTVTDLVGLALVVVTVALSIFMNKTAKAKAA